MSEGKLLIWTRVAMVRAVWGLLLGLSVVPSQSWAVMPPEDEASAAWERIQRAQQSRNAATDVVRLQVEKLEVSRSDERCPQIVRWNLQGRLLSVSRGSLQPGGSVHIIHEWEDYKCPGPVHESIPHFVQGDETDAYLQCQPNGECELAAGRLSLVSQADFSAEVQGRKYVLDKYFPPPLVVAFKRDRIVPEGQAEVEAQLSHLCERLRSRLEKRVRLRGYTDSRGSSEVCLVRSARYVEWVKRKLLDAGCEAGRIRVEAYGKEKNDVHAPEMQGKPQNRVELNEF